MNSRHLVAQLGARMHYAVPRILATAGALERFFTDLCPDLGWPRALKLIPRALLPSAGRRILDRHPAGVPLDRVTAFNRFGLEYAGRRRRAETPSALSAAHLWGGREFCRLVLRAGLGEAGGVYCFNSAGLEILQQAGREGRGAALEQTIAPKRVEARLLEEERRVFPDWEPDAATDEFATECAAREEAEWSAAKVILCGSEFVREGIAQCGGPAEKCVVMPYGVDVVSPAPRLAGEDAAGRPLQVLTVGAVGLRKGSPYVLEAARRLGGRARFRMVGSVGVGRPAQACLREHVELTGAVPRSQVAEHFRRADVFLLPSICEGSATATYEALAHGVPVVCTPNSGSVVRNGCEGFIVPPQDAEAIVEKIGILCEDRGLLVEMRRRASERAQSFTVEAYGVRLLAALGR